VGSVSGGCVEGAVYEEAKDVVESGVPILERYGVSDDDAFAVGLTCGGILDVFVESVSRESFPELGEIAASVGAHEPVAVVTVVKGPTTASAVGWCSGPTAPRARSGCSDSTTPSPPTRAACWPRAGPGFCTSATTASAAATTSPSS
jgi:xanthine/CO dehydrogenase XdhC/CoxF family maturation factor